MQARATRLKYELPQGVVVLRTVYSNMLWNLRNTNEAKFNMPPLVQRAYTVVEETGVMPTRDYPASDEFLEQQ